MTAVSTRSTPDVLVIGTGLIGLACAVAAAERGLMVLVIGESQVGAASLAAAGLLAPSIERGESDSAGFAIAARDRYPSYIDWLRDRSGVDVPLNRDGIIQVAVSDAGVRGLQRSMPTEAEWLDARTLHVLEPALSHGLGGVLHATDGAVDNVRLYDALLTTARRESRVRIIEDLIVDIRLSESAVSATGRSGAAYTAAQAILAAGAWSNSIRGLPRPLPVEPVRGQMIAYATAALRRAVYGPTGYVVPRASGRTLVGATTERVGFNSATTAEGIARLQQTAVEILPRLAGVAPSDAWAGLRPMSADLQPILGRDPDEPRLLYATGHSRNGVLMTPLTGDCIAALLVDEPPPAEIAMFSIGRFGSASSDSLLSNQQ